MYLSLVLAPTRKYLYLAFFHINLTCFLRGRLQMYLAVPKQKIPTGNSGSIAISKIFTAYVYILAALSGGNLPSWFSGKIR
jgi:hypothetical protein